MDFKVVLILVFLCLASYRGFSQITVPDEEQGDRIGSGILDDSTKQIYGPTTTQYTFERNIKYNHPHSWGIDTSIVNHHQYQYTRRNQNLYQDLGNIGTAITPVYPLLPGGIGATSGFTLYDLYFIGPDQIKVYDTKSPYSRFNVIWGGGGRSLTEATYTRNIDERSNIGFDFRGLFIDKQIQRAGRGDRHTEGIYYTGYANYRTRNGRYQVLGNFIRNRHKVDEYGGILTDGTEADNDVFFDENREVTLTEAQTDELRTNYHLYQQYKFSSLMQVYHSYDRYKQQNDFRDVADTASTFFDFVEIDSAITHDRSKMIYRQHEVGLKGDVGKAFYSIYYRGREVNFKYKYLHGDSLGVDTYYMENYAGFHLRFGDDSVRHISAYGEYLQGGEFKLGGEIRNRWFFARATSTKYTPSFVQQAYRGSHDYWVNNDFDSPISSRLVAGVKFKLGPVTVAPSAEYNLLSNYIYFKKFDVEEGEQSVLPAQTSGDINILKGQLDLSVDFFRVFNFNTQLIYSDVSGGSAEAVRVPGLLANNQLSYHDILFDGNLEWHIGIEMHMKTPYYAPGYDPVIMQFYNQDEFEVPFYPITDIFLNAKINRGRFFIKYNNFLQLFRENGYFATPDYPGQQNIFDFGFDWSFYD